MIQVFLVPSEYISQAWLVAEPMIKKAVERVEARLSTFDVFEAITANQYQLWLVAKHETPIAAFVTNIQQHPKTRGINMPYLGGEEIDLWYHDALAKVEQFGRDHGCTIAEFNGRPGWKRLMESSGYKVLTMTYEKLL